MNLSPRTFGALVALGVPDTDASSITAELRDALDLVTDESTATLVEEWAEAAKAPPEAFQPKGSPQAALRTVLAFRRPRAVVQLAVWAQETGSCTASSPKPPIG